MTLDPRGDGRRVAEKRNISFVRVRRAASACISSWKVFHCAASACISSAVRRPYAQCMYIQGVEAFMAHSALWLELEARSARGADELEAGCKRSYAI